MKGEKCSLTSPFIEQAFALRTQIVSDMGIFRQLSDFKRRLREVAWLRARKFLQLDNGSFWAHCCRLVVGSLFLAHLSLLGSGFQSRIGALGKHKFIKKYVMKRTAMCPGEPEGTAAGASALAEDHC